MRSVARHRLYFEPAQVSSFAVTLDEESQSWTQTLPNSPAERFIDSEIRTKEGNSSFGVRWRMDQVERSQGADWPPPEKIDIVETSHERSDPRGNSGLQRGPSELSTLSAKPM